MHPFFHGLHLGPDHLPHFGAVPLSVANMVELDVECTVCHVVGVIEVRAEEQPAISSSWGSMTCAFTDGCIGHVWPEAVN